MIEARGLRLCDPRGEVAGAEVEARLFITPRNQTCKAKRLTSLASEQRTIEQKFSGAFAIGGHSLTLPIPILTPARHHCGMFNIDTECA